MILGEVDASAAAVLVTRYLAAGAARRVTTIGRLRAAGFRVVHSATKANRLHVSVYPPLTEAGEPAAWGGELAPGSTHAYVNLVAQLWITDPNTGISSLGNL